MRKQYKNPQRIPNDVAQLAYIAGILDGEGSIIISSARSKKSVNLSHSLNLVFANSDDELMLWLQHRCGGTMYMRPATAKWKSMYRLEVYGRQAEQLIYAICPFLIVKRARAAIAIAFFNLRDGHRGRHRLDPETVAQRESLKQRLHVLNRRGAPLQAVGGRI